MLAKEFIHILSQNPEAEIQVVGWYAGGLPVFNSITNEHVKTGEHFIFIGAEPLDPLVSKFREKPAERPKIEDGEPQTEN